MNLIKTSFLSAVETAIKLAAGFVVVKFIAIRVGPEGIAYFGQFQNFIAAFVALISGSSFTGLVRFSAQEKMQNKTSHNYLANVLGLGLLSTLIVGGFIYLFADKLSFVLLNTDAYRNLFYLLSSCGFLIMFYQVAIAVFNGWGELKKLILCKIIASLLLLISSIILVSLYGIAGGFVSLICMQAIPAFISLWLMLKVKNFRWSWLRPRFDFSIYKELLPYWLMSVVTLISSPLMLLLIRSYIADNSDWETAGFWEASWKLTELYLLIITSALATYYVPKLSQATCNKDEIDVIKEVLLLGLLAAIFLALGMYFFRYTIVDLLFASNFTIVADILPFQLLGSVIKIPAWIFAYHMLIKQRTVLFLLSELLFGVMFYFLAHLLFHKFGLLGLSYAYFLNYVFYLIFCSLYFFRFKEQQVFINLET